MARCRVPQGAPRGGTRRHAAAGNGGTERCGDIFIELAEVLDCPDCRASAGLVAFVDRAASRRVVEGRLGCPLCEIEVPIRGGTMRFDLSAAAGSTPALVAPDAGEADPEAAMRLAALMGVTDRAGAAVLLGPGLTVHAPAVARLADRLEVLTWLPPPGDSSAAAGPASLPVEDLAAGVDPLCGAAPDGWPVRSGALHGIALAESLAPLLPEITRCARPGARLVVEGPTRPDLAALAGSSFVQVASDATVWVGERARNFHGA